jgi:hypothetical protein
MLTFVRYELKRVSSLEKQACIPIMGPWHLVEKFYEVDTGALGVHKYLRTYCWNVGNKNSSARETHEFNSNDLEVQLPGDTLSDYCASCLRRNVFTLAVRAMIKKRSEV